MIMTGFHFLEDTVDILVPIPSSLSSIKNPTYYVNKHKKSLKRQRKEGRLTRELGSPKNDMVMSFLAFIFASCIPDCILEKLETQKCP
jgi:hypothetical protein